MTEIAVVSGKGGTGKTSISAAFAMLNEEKVVVDCDVDAANLYLVLQPSNYLEKSFTTGYKAVLDQQLCTQCGKCVRYCRFGAISFSGHQIEISETSCDGCFLCTHVCPENAISMLASDKSKWFAGNFRHGKMVHARLSPGEENSGKLVNVVRDQARKISTETKLETILIDGPPGTGCPVISAVTGANVVLVVTEPSVSGFHDLKRIVELTAGFKIKTYVAINKFDLNHDISAQIADWCTNNGFGLAGQIPFEPKIVEAMLDCKSIIEYAPQSAASVAIGNIWDKISNPH
jgi:MinD superfamily P-loop ATPase